MNDAPGGVGSKPFTSWWRPWARVALLVAGAAVWLATSPARVKVRAYPSWELAAEPQPALGCAVLAVEVSKSGKEGLGLTVKATTDEATGCEVRLTSVALQVEAQAVIGQPKPGALSLSAGTPQFMYVAFPFDNEAAWNAGDRRATLTLSWEVAGVAKPPRVISLEHRVDALLEDTTKRAR